MKGFLLATTLLAGVLPATAADVAQKPQRPEPPQVACSWCGFELAVHGGWGWGETRPDFNIAPFATPSQDGWLVGGSATYRWQPGKGAFVFGLGLDYSFADIKEDQVVGMTTLHTKFEHLASARAHAGIAIDRMLIYGDAGIAFAKAKASVDFGPATFATANANLWGYVVGGGVDYKLAEHIVIGADYSYYGFGKQTYDFVLTGSPLVLGVNADTNVQVIRGKLGVRF